MNTHTSLDTWIAEDAIPFSLNSNEQFNSAVDSLMSSLNPTVELLGYGEALHGSEEILQLRNRLFQRLVEKHGYSAIAIESSFPRAHITNEYIMGRGPTSFEEVQKTGFGSGFDQLEANHQLVEWMRSYNDDPKHERKLRFYGIDIPSGTVGIGSPRQVLHFVLDYLASIGTDNTERRKQIDQLLGEDNDWENPEAHMDHTKSIGQSPRAISLRLETENLISELKARSPELIEQTDKDTFMEALQHAQVARGLLNFHASMAKPVDYAERLGIRDTLQADNLTYMVERERGRGKVFVFAHNSHLKKGKAEWQLGPELITWWPAGSQVHQILGDHYAVIGTAVGVSEDNGIVKPEDETLESRIMATPGPMRFIPTHLGKGFEQSELKTIPVRSSSTKNPTYFPLTAQSFTDFDWIAMVDETKYNIGGPSLQEWDS